MKALMLTALAALMAFPAAAAPQCGPRPEVTEAIRAQLGQSRRMIGLDAALSVVEVWADRAGLWTLTVTSANNVTCIIGSGDNFAAAPAPAGEVM